MSAFAGRAAVAASIALFATFTLLSQWRSPAEAPELSRLFAAWFLPVNWIAATLAWRAAGAVPLEPKGRAAWRLLALGWALLGVNNLLFYAARHVGTFPGQDVLIAVVVPLLWYAAVFSALARLPRRVESGFERAAFWLDVTTVFVSGLLILYYVFSRIPGRSSLSSPLAALTSLGFPALDGVLMFAAVVVVLRPARGVSRQAVGLLAASLASILVADLGYGRAAAIGQHRPGIWYEPFYLLAPCLAAVAAQLQRERPGRDEPAWLAAVSIGSSVVPHALVVGAVGVLVLETGERWDTALGRMVFAAIVLTALVMARQLIARRHIVLLAAAEQARLTRQAAIETQLQQAQKMEAVGQLAGGIAHDFNNILTSIRASAELASDSGAPAEDMAEIVRAVDHGASLTRQLLAFGRRDAVQVTRFDLRAVVREMDRMVRRVLPAGIDVRVVLPDAEVPVEMDRGQLEQVLLNLAINARDAMPEGGRLELRVDATHVAVGAYARLAVSDTGHGMSDDVIARMYEPFFTTKPRGKGTGLGLSTVYAIIARAGGTIEVHSEVGRGTTFEVSVPLAESAEGLAAPVARARTGGAREGGAHGEVVLVVDDEPAIREVVRRYLASQGFSVLAAADSAEALVYLGDVQQGVDLLLTDIVMPGMDGRALAERARAMHPGLPVICMSGYADQHRAAGSPALQGVRHLAKPFELETLGRLVRSTLPDPDGGGGAER